MVVGPCRQLDTAGSLTLAQTVNFVVLQPESLTGQSVSQSDTLIYSITDCSRLNTTYGIVSNKKLFLEYLQSYIEENYLPCYVNVSLFENG